MIKDQITKRLMELGKKSGEDIGDIVEWIENKEKHLKHQVHRFATFVETARQINAKALDLEHIEGYSLNTIRGQALVNDVLMFRQEISFDLDQSTMIKCFHQDFTLEFEDDCPFAKKLCEFGHTYLIHDGENADSFDREMLKFDEVQAFLGSGYRLLVPLMHEDNQMIGMFAIGPKLTGGDFTGDDFSFLWLLAEMVSMAVHNAMLYQRSITDGLTQVHSRGYFDCWLDEEFHRLNRYHAHAKDGSGWAREVSLIMIDIDNFKDVNDTHGHQVGDRVLREVAGCLAGQIRNSDQIARYGGEEFVIFCPESGMDEAEILAERLRKAVAKLRFDVGEGEELRVTISVGIASYPETAAGERDLVFRADQALYAAKEGGRDRVVRADHSVLD